MCMHTQVHINMQIRINHTRDLTYAQTDTWCVRAYIPCMHKCTATCQIRDHTHLCASAHTPYFAYIYTSCVYETIDHNLTRVYACVHVYLHIFMYVGQTPRTHGKRAHDCFETAGRRSVVFVCMAYIHTYTRIHIHRCLIYS
jgi:hypothetical protein